MCFDILSDILSDSLSGIPCYILSDLRRCAHLDLELAVEGGEVGGEGRGKGGRGEGEGGWDAPLIKSI